MADGSIILDIEARDAGLVQTLAQARQYAAKTATGMAQLAAAILHTGSVSNSTSQATRSLLSALNLTAQGARNLTSAFRQQQSGVLSAMSAMVTGAVTIARMGTAQLQAAGISWGNSLTNGLRSGLSGVINASTTGVNAALTPWRSAVNSAVNVGYGVSSGIAQGMNSGNPLLRSAASQSAHLAKSAFSGVNWPSLGYQISAGIAQGIRNGSALISDAARAAALSALATAKKALGIRSPSRLFRDEVGRQISRGLALGILDGAGEARGAADQLARQLSDFSRRTLSPSAPFTAPQTIVNTTTVRNVSAAPVVLEAPVYLDGREIARASAQYTGRRMAFLEGLT